MRVYGTDIFIFIFIFQGPGEYYKTWLAISARRIHRHLTASPVLISWQGKH
jgi:hypothetical protein